MWLSIVSHTRLSDQHPEGRRRDHRLRPIHCPIGPSRCDPERAGLDVPAHRRSFNLRCTSHSVILSRSCTLEDLHRGLASSLDGPSVLSLSVCRWSHKHRESEHELDDLRSTITPCNRVSPCPTPTCRPAVAGDRRAADAPRRRAVRNERRHRAYQSFVNWLQYRHWADAPGQSNPITLNHAAGDPESDASCSLTIGSTSPGTAPTRTPSPRPERHLSSYVQRPGQLQIEYPSTHPLHGPEPDLQPSTNTTTADLVVPAGDTTTSSGSSSPTPRRRPPAATNTGFTNARLIRPGYAADCTQLFTNEFLSALPPSSMLRYLDPTTPTASRFSTATRW